MDTNRLASELQGLVFAEDDAQRKLYEARNKTQALIQDNLEPLVRMGVVSVKVNRAMLGRLINTIAR